MSAEQKQRLHDYLAENREAMTWKAEGLSEYDVRRPLTPTGTNLLGLIKHLSIAEAWYFGQTFGRRSRRTCRGGMTMHQKTPICGQLPPRPAAKFSAHTAPRPLMPTKRSAPSISTLPGACRGGRNPMSRCTPCSCTSSPRLLATPDTPTSCANNSTGAPGCEQAT